MFVVEEDGGDVGTVDQVASCRRWWRDNSSSLQLKFVIDHLQFFVE
jgi:hypothetical protein